MVEDLNERCRRRLRAAVRRPLAVCALLGWLIPAACSVFFAHKAATFVPKTDFDNWDRVFLEFGSDACVVGAAVWLLVSVLGLVVYLVMPARQEPGHCRRCRYDLTGNVSGVCPECGDAVPGGPQA